MKTTELLNGKKEDCGSPLRSIRNDSDNSVRKDRVFFPALALALFFCANLHAQVTIGGLTEPASGAILDLNSSVKGGLILSNVTITDREKIPHDASVFQGITDDDVNPELRGAMVYNDGKDPAVPAGIYIWNGSCWTKNGGEVIVNQPAITVDGAVKPAVAVTVGNSVKLAVASPQPDVSYEWFQNAAASNSGGTSVSVSETYDTPTDLALGTLYYYCMATSLICSSVSVVSSVIAVTTINPTILPPPGAIGTLSGPTCFDVAATNDGPGCGKLDARQSGKRFFADFPTETYTFIPSDVTGLFFDYKNLDNDHPVIKSLEQVGNTVIVTFHTDLNTRAAGLIRADALKAELYAVYNGMYSTMLTLSVSDCQCCPGLLVVGGEYEDIAMTSTLPPGYDTFNDNGSAARIIMQAFKKSGSDLCYYYRDAESSGYDYAPKSFNWYDAISSPLARPPFIIGVCQTTHGVDAADDHDDWRLPNLAELAQIGQLVSKNGSETLDAGVGSQTDVNTAISQGTNYSNGIAFPAGSNTTSSGTYNLRHTDYWSSTGYDDANAWYWTFFSSERRAGYNSKTYIGYVRCVRRF
jgi:uncharacterized protein (TIGR02145 family)